MKRHETPGCPCRSPLLLVSLFFFSFFEEYTAQREKERESQLVVYTLAIVARECIIALIKRYILWTTRYNNGAKSCVLLHDKGGN